DQVRCNEVSESARACHLHTHTAAGDQVPLGGGGAADRVGLALDEDSLARAGKSLRSGGVGAEVIAFDPVYRVANVDEAGFESHDDVTVLRSGASDEVGRRIDLHGSAADRVEGCARGAAGRIGSDEVAGDPIAAREQ